MQGNSVKVGVGEKYPPGPDLGNYTWKATFEFRCFSELYGAVLLLEWR